MDIFTDVDIFSDLLDAAARHVPVYILLDELNAHHFVAMVNNCRVNLDLIHVSWNGIYYWVNIIGTFSSCSLLATCHLFSCCTATPSALLLDNMAPLCLIMVSADDACEDGGGNNILLPNREIFQGTG